MNKQSISEGSASSARRAGWKLDILVEWARSALPAIAGMLILCLSASGAAGQATIYNAIPSPLPPNELSQCFQCAQVFELGDEIQFAGTARALKSVTVTMSDWAKHSDWPTYPAAGFTIPVTLNLYNVNAGPTVGSLIKSVTVNQTIPWRPETSAACGGDDAWQASDANCYHGLAANITFDLSSQNVVVPDKIIYSLAINTESWGYAPIGVDGPYDSLNVGLLDSSPSYSNGGPPSVGSDVDTSAMFQYSTWSGEYCAPTPVGVFRWDPGCWNGIPGATDTFGTISAEFDACDCLIGGVCYTSGATNPANQCEQCTPAASQVGWANKPNGTGCNFDSLACTQNDSCQAGHCTVGTPVVCAASDQCHVAGTCQEPSGTCSNPNKANGTPCNDGNACTFQDKCISGQCLGVTDSHGTFCDDHNPCTTDSCNPTSGCVHINNTASCTDGNACTSNDACSGGQCVGGAATNCDDKNPCTADSCDASSGCAHSNVPDGTQCASSAGAAGTCESGGCCLPAVAGVQGVQQSLLAAIEQACPSCPRNQPTHAKYVKCVKGMTKLARQYRNITTKQQKAINAAANSAH